MQTLKSSAIEDDNSSVDEKTPSPSLDFDSNLDDTTFLTDLEVQDDGRIDLQVDSKLRFTSKFLPDIENEELQKHRKQSTYSNWQRASCGAPPSTPPLSIVVQVVGSRGDVQPFIAIGQELTEHGHRVRIATHCIFRSLVLDHGLEFFDIGGDPEELISYMVRNPALLPSYRSFTRGEVRRKRAIVRKFMERCWLSCFEMDQSKTHPFAADAIIANPPSFAHVHCAQKLGIPLHMVFTMPWTPTRSFGHPLTKNRTNSMDEAISNYLSFILVDMLIWQGLKRDINSFRTETLGLEPINSKWGSVMLHRLEIPFTYCWSPTLVPKPRDWPNQVSVAGFCIAPLASAYRPPEEFRDFLQDGPPPIYVGFGSVVVDDPEVLTSLVYEAIRLTGVRAVIGRGWSGLGDTMPAELRSQLFVIDSCPHEWLFQHVSCVVHHGGAGTTAAGLAAGKPTVAIPFFGDQFFWAKVVERVGAGPPALPYRQLTVEKLVENINTALMPDCIETAGRLAGKLAAESGAREVSRLFHSSLPLQSMACSLCPSRVVVWRYRRKNVDLRLSNFAVTVLRKAGLVDSKHLKLCRIVEYGMDQGPLEPFGSGVKAFADIVYDTLAGFGKMATEIDNIATRVGEMGHSQSDAALIYGAGPSNTPSGAVREVKVGEAFVSGAGKVAGASLRAPGNVTLALAQGARNMPRLWHDRTLRTQPEVKGIGSGIAIGCKEMFLSTYDSIAGLIAQPYSGAREGGILGGLKGASKGLVSAPIKLFAAMAAPMAYPLKGVEVEIDHLISRSKRDPMLVTRTQQGELDYRASGEDEKQAVLARWFELQSGTS